MSCEPDMTAANGTDHVANGVATDEQAYEPTYEEAFPPLAGGPGGMGMSAPTSHPTVAWKNKLVRVKPSAVTQVFCVPLEERRYANKEQTFGEKVNQGKICQEIMTKTGVAIEMSSAKDKSLTVVITGKNDAVMKARKMVVQQLQTQARTSMNIPKEHHRYILGAKGQRVQELELNTATKINIPRVEENSDLITITGTKEGIERAQHEIQTISDEQAKLALERLDIPKVYHPFICGPDNSVLKDLQTKTGVNIRVPPPAFDRNEIIVSGEKEGVAEAVATIMKIYKDKLKRCGTVSVQVRKSQHKYVIGPRGSNLSEILGATGVSVEVPKLDEMSDTITLRGDQEKLAAALSIVYDKANSVVTSYVECPAWLHKFIIGRKGAKINKITEEFEKVHIEFQEGKDKIELEGPPTEVDGAERTLEAIVSDLIKNMAFAELIVEQKYHKHIIGKAGSNVGRIKEETGVQIRIPPDNENSNTIRIEGTPAGVQTAKTELEEMVKKMENEKSRDIMIEQRFHKTIIGQQGAKIKEIRDHFNQVQISFPDSAQRCDVVTLRGPKNDVDKCFTYLRHMNEELVASNYKVDVHIFKDFHKNVIGKGGATIRKIRDETNTKIDLPNEKADSDVISITGKKADVEEARKRVEAIQKELANIVEVKLQIPSKFHNSIIGTKGRLIRSVMDECGGVNIRFPSEGSKSDEVIIRGPQDDVDKAKKQLIELSNERKESGHTIEIRCKPEYHRFLIGKGGSNVRQLRETTGARVIFPSNGDPDAEVIVIMGKKEGAEAAQKELEERIVSLENVVETQISVDPKYHRHFVIRRGEVLRMIGDEFGGVAVSFPRMGTNTDKVTIKGAADCVEGASARIQAIVADLVAQVTIDCVIEQKYHRTVMGPKGSKVQQITSDWDVAIKFPDRPQQQQRGDGPTEEGDAPVAPAAPITNGDHAEANGDSDGPSKQDIITISGRNDNCEGAKNALLALVPISKDVPIPTDLHRFIIGSRGKDVRQMMEDYDVNISVPSADLQSEIIVVKGSPSNVMRAEAALQARVEQLEVEKGDRQARAFQLEVRVAPGFHPKIIGRKGAVISKIRLDNEVQIQFPSRGAEEEDLITITGYEQNAEAAKRDILAIVKELEDMVTEEVPIDHRIHPRIIGARGRNVRKLMDDYKVDIRFPQQEDTDPNLVRITGDSENVYDVKEYLLNMEEEFIQDIIDEEDMERHSYSLSHRNDDKPKSDGKAAGFVVRDAPWSSAAPDMKSAEDFPDFGAAAPAPASKAPSWGPWRK